MSKDKKEKDLILKEPVSRRDFLKTVSIATGSMILGASSIASGYKQIKGYKNSYGMLVDLTMCVGCRSCEKACNKVNNLPRPDLPFDDATVFEELRRPTAKAYTVVNRYDIKGYEGGPVYRKIQCNHCNEPACFSACPIHAYTKTPEGAVLYNVDKCFGCRYCMIACPFYVPAYDYESAFEPRIMKCIFCYPRIKNNKIPACAEACPTGTLTFGRREDLIRLARKKILRNPSRYIDHIYGEHEVGGTSWLYISGVPFEEVGLPTDLPEVPLITQVKGFLSAVPVVFTVWPALFGMCYVAVKHRSNANKEKSTRKEGKDES
jgi:Fe-S-cluster-containing dehydrogenase component